MNRTEELRQQLMGQLSAAIDSYERCNGEQYDTAHVQLDYITAKRMHELLGKLEGPKDAKWHYYTNDEDKPRWKCTTCGKLCRRRPTDKLYCSRCGSKMSFER